MIQQKIYDVINRKECNFSQKCFKRKLKFVILALNHFITTVHVRIIIYKYPYPQILDLQKMLFNSSECVKSLDFSTVNDTMPSFTFKQIMI